MKKNKNFKVPMAKPDNRERSPDYFAIFAIGFFIFYSLLTFILFTLLYIKSL
jgi:hypothetical protein